MQNTILLKKVFYKSFLDNELEFNVDLCKVEELDEYKEEATLDDWQIKNSFFVILKFNHKNNLFSSLLLRTEDLKNIKNTLKDLAVLLIVTLLSKI